MFLSPPPRKTKIACITAAVLNKRLYGVIVFVEVLLWVMNTVEVVYVFAGYRQARLWGRVFVVECTARLTTLVLRRWKTHARGGKEENEGKNPFAKSYTTNRLVEEEKAEASWRSTWLELAGRGGGGVMAAQATSSLGGSRCVSLERRRGR